MKSALFRQQHSEILGLVTEIKIRIEAADSTRDSAPELRSLIGLLATVLGKHLEIEDRVIYPKLIASKNQATSETASRFKKEMGGLAAMFESFVTRWSTDGNIEQNPAELNSEFRGLFSLLWMRIEKEENVLYDLLDKSGFD
jgi:iron-sulfur cluster repair protein YtfE (RIC family)